MRYFVEFHFAQVQDGWAIPMRELAERYDAALTILYGESEASDEEEIIDKLIEDIRAGR